MATIRSPIDVAKLLAQRCKTLRLSQNFSQQTLAEHSGVSLGTLKKFERTGKISLESLLKIALTLDALGEFEELMKSPTNILQTTLDELLNEKNRKRGRR